MARKRLNKKVAIIGSIALMLMAVAVVGIFLYLSRDTEKFMQDGDAAILAAREATDPELKEQEYAKAKKNYLRVRAHSKTDSLKVDALFKLIEVFLDTDKWNNVRGCWGEITKLEPENVSARFGRLKFTHIVADEGAEQLWPDVESQTSEFIDLAVESLLTEGIDKYEIFRMRKETVATKLGAYLYLLRGRARLEIAKRGSITNPEEYLDNAINDMEKALEFEYDNVNTYWFLAQSIIEKGNIYASRADIEQQDKSRQEAKQILEKAVEAAPDNANAQINLLTMKPLIEKMSSEQVIELESDFLQLADSFNLSAEAFGSLADFYWGLDTVWSFGYKNLDKAINAIDKATELDNENVDYAISAISMYYRKFSLYDDWELNDQPAIYPIIKMVKKALELPGAQDTLGPMEWSNKRKKGMLYVLLADYSIGQILEPSQPLNESQKQQLLTDAEQAVYEIEQFYGSGQAPQVIKWQGMLDLAHGKNAIAIRKLYTIYEQLRASKQQSAMMDETLCYTLAKLFKNSKEVGAALEFIQAALNSRIIINKPQVILDYADILFRLDTLEAYTAALDAVSGFENIYWPTERSKILRTRAYINTLQFDEAEKQIAQRDLDDPITIKLQWQLLSAKSRQIQKAVTAKQINESTDAVFQEPSDSITDNAQLQQDSELLTAELIRYRQQSAELVEKVLEIDPNSVRPVDIAAICNYYREKDDINKANNVVNRYLEHFPHNTLTLAYKKTLEEPDPKEVSQQRLKEIEIEVLSDISDLDTRATKLGLFYFRNNEFEKARDQLRKVIKLEDQTSMQTDALTSLQKVAVDYLFRISLFTKDWDMAQKLTDIARRENLDGCEGVFFHARIVLAKKNYKDALTKLDESLKLRPVFSTAYKLRSNTNFYLGNNPAAIADAKKAATLNPLDSDLAKLLADLLFQRNQKLGDNVTADQLVETKIAMNNALKLNPNDLQLLSFYAQYISDTEPRKALAIRQSLLKNFPTVENALLLGKLATRIVNQETNAEIKKALLAIAESSFKQAKTADPNSTFVIESYAQFYRDTGQNEKAEALLEKSNDIQLLWNHYLQTGKLEQAKTILQQQYENDPKNINTVKGLLLIAEKTADIEAIKNYSEQLLVLEDTAENNLFQIQTFLKFGFVEEGRNKLQAFKEKYPDNSQVLLLDAWLEMRQGQLPKALKLANQALESGQNNPEIWKLRGEINRLLTNYSQAVTDFQKSLSLTNNPEVQISLAKVYLRMARNDDAITELENNINGTQATNQARIMLEQLYTRLRRKDELIRLYNQTLEKFPDNVIWHSKAAAFAIKIRDYEKAEKLFEIAWQMSREQGEGHIGSLSGYLKALTLNKKMDKFYVEAGKYVDGQFAPVAFISMAEAKLGQGDKTTAIQYCRKAIDKAGDNEDTVVIVLQKMYQLLGSEEVRKYCEEKLVTSPDSLATNITMYNLAKLNKQYNKAIQHIDKCIQIVEDDSQRQYNYIVSKAMTLQLAYSQTSDNNYLRQAIATYESLLRKQPNNNSVLNNLAYFLVENNEQLEKALEYAKRAHQAKPNNPMFLDTYSYALYKNGDYQQADKYLLAALQYYEQSRTDISWDVYEHLGLIKEKLESKKEAIEAYKQAMQIISENEQIPTDVKTRIQTAIERLSQ